MTLNEANRIYSKPIIKQMLLTFSGGAEITNSEICSEEMSLEESLFSDDTLKFGACESSCFKIRVVNNGSFKGQTVTVEQLIADSSGRIITSDGDYLTDDDGDYILFADNSSEPTSIPYGTFKVYSDEPSNDRMWRDLTCYDAMYDIINADVAAWYQNLTFPMTIKQLRDSFFTYLGITQKTQTLVNDSLSVGGNFTVEGTLSGKTVIEAICEMNFVFGHIARDGKFEYIDVTDAESLTYEWYVDESGKYEDYTTDLITGIVARAESGDVGTSVGTNTNPYYITDNPLVYGLEGTAELETALNNLLDMVETFTYRPFEVDTYGNPVMPIGTNITINTKKYDTENGYQPFAINSIVVRRELKGIQGLIDSLVTPGEKEVEENVNSIQSEIKRTKGKMHIIENTVDTFKSEITNVESMVAYTVNMRSASTFPFTVMGDFLTEEEYENLIGTETFIANHDIDTYYPANKYIGKYVLETNGGGDGLPILYSSDGTDWNVSKQATTPLSTQSNTRIWEHESQDNDKLVGFALEDNLNYLVAVRLNADITPSANGLCLQFDLPGLSSSSVNRTCVRPVYKQGSPFTASDTLSEGQIIYLQFIPYSDISDEPNPYGFKYVWNMLEDNIQRSTSVIEQLSNEIVLKVDSNGHLAEVSLSADPDTYGTTLELTADNINFTSFNLNMQTTNFELTSNNLTLDKNGLTVNGNNFTTQVTSDSFKVTREDTSYTQETILNGSSLTLYDERYGYERYMELSTQQLKIYTDNTGDTISISPTDVYLQSGWINSEPSLKTVLGRLGSTQAAEPSAVNVSTSTWTSLASVTLSGGVWLILAKARFASNATGRRGVRISTSSSGSEVGQLAVDSETAVSGSETHVSCMWITSNLSSSTSFYLQGWQNSGSTLSTLPRIKAVRIR